MRQEGTRYELRCRFRGSGGGDWIVGGTCVGAGVGIVARLDATDAGESSGAEVDAERREVPLHE